MIKQVSVFQPGWDRLSGGERPRLNSERLSREEQEKVGAYLEAGAVVMHTTAKGTDILDNDAPVVPLTIRTDGEYVWTGPVTYYVQTYGVAPDAEFLEYLRQRDYVPRTASEEEVRAAAAVFMPPQQESN